MVKRIHILGASGSGTTTLGRALAERLQYPHFDTDDYFWLPTDPPYTQQRARTERAQLLMDDLTPCLAPDLDQALEAEQEDALLRALA